MQLLQERRPFPGPKSRLLSNTQKWVVQWDTCADKAKTLLGRGTQENCCATWLRVSGFMVMGLVSGFCSQSFWLRVLSWWCTYHLAKMDCSEEDSGRLLEHMDWSLLSPFDLSWILPVHGSLLVPSYSPGNSCCKITHVRGHHLAWPERVVSVSGVP